MSCCGHSGPFLEFCHGHSVTVPVSTPVKLQPYIVFTTDHIFSSLHLLIIFHTGQYCRLLNHFHLRKPLSSFSAL